jgi:hypothetical protein
MECVALPWNSLLAFCCLPDGLTKKKSFHAAFSARGPVHHTNRTQMASSHDIGMMSDALERIFIGKIQ